MLTNGAVGFQKLHGSIEGIATLARAPMAKALRSHVSLLWDYRSEPPPRLERLLVAVEAQFLINRDMDELSHCNVDGSTRTQSAGAAIQGVLTRPVLIDAGQKRAICGVQFTPGGLAAFTYRPATNFTNALVNAAEVWGSCAPTLRTDLIAESDARKRLDAIERFLLARLRPATGSDRLVRQAVTMLRRGDTAQSVRESLHISQRAFHALMDTQVGVRPKLFARIARIGVAVDNLSDRTSWSDLAAGTGFADQAHMVREFGMLAGGTPTAYRSLSPSEPRHSRD